MTEKDLLQDIVEELGFVDFTTGCNCEQTAPSHVKRLVEHYNTPDCSNLLSSHGWGLCRHTTGQIIVTHRNGEKVTIRENTHCKIEAMFYRMMDDFITAQ